MKEPVLDVRLKIKGPAFEPIYKEARRTNSTYAKVLIENAIQNLDEKNKTQPYDFSQFQKQFDRQAEKIIDLNDKVEKLTYIVESFVDLFINIIPSDSYKTDGHNIIIKDRYNQLLNLVQKRIKKEISTITEQLEGEIR